MVRVRSVSSLGDWGWGPSACEHAHVARLEFLFFAIPDRDTNTGAPFDQWLPTATLRIQRSLRPPLASRCMGLVLTCGNSFRVTGQTLVTRFVQPTVRPDP